MPRKRSSSTLTPARIGRLYRLLQLVSEAPHNRLFLLKKLRMDLRGFYRDLEKIRERKVRLQLIEGEYQLKESFESALGKLPFPDPKLTLHEAMLLADGDSEVQEKLQKQINKLTRFKK